MNRVKQSVRDLPRGAVVSAARPLDGGYVRVDTLGVVFETANHHHDDAGPLVRWVDGLICNVYDGDVNVIYR